MQELDLSKEIEVKVPIQPHFAGEYRLEYDGKYITLFGKDFGFKGFKFDQSEPDWYEEMVLVPVVKEVRRASPEIAKVDDNFIYITLNIGNDD